MPQNDPFLPEIQNIHRFANQALERSLELKGDEADRMFAEFKRRLALAEELVELSIAWNANQITQVVAELRILVLREKARQSDVFGRLNEFLGSLGGQSVPATDPAIGHENTAETSGGLQPSPGEPGSVPAASTEIDPNKRYASLDLLHPSFRKKVLELQEKLAQANVPMKIFESFRTPERQNHLYAQGRTRALHKGKVTNARAWESFHQYGVAVDMVIDHPHYGMWDTSDATSRGWWDKYHEIARSIGLEPLSFEKPHVQPQDITLSQLLAGEQPGDGDDSWFDNFSAAVNRWPGAKKPPINRLERPEISSFADATPVSEIDWSKMPKMSNFALTNFGFGQSWRVNETGIHLESSGGPLRTPGQPITVLRALEVHGKAIADAAVEFDVPPEIILMTIATETALYRKYDFSGQKTFRWETHSKLSHTGDVNLDGTLGDYSAGPMQVMSSTARWVNEVKNLGFTNAKLKAYQNKPASPPASLGLYESGINIRIGTAYIDMQRNKTGLNPILVAAAFNAGGLYASGGNSWGLKVTGDHLDRAARWLGDAQLACDLFR